MNDKHSSRSTFSTEKNDERGKNKERKSKKKQSRANNNDDDDDGANQGSEYLILPPFSPSRSTGGVGERAPVNICTWATDYVSDDSIHKRRKSGEVFGHYIKNVCETQLDRGMSEETNTSEKQPKGATETGSDETRMKHLSDPGNSGPPDLSKHCEHYHDVSAYSGRTAATATNTLPRKNHKSRDNLTKTALSKVDASRNRQKPVSDSRFTHSAASGDKSELHSWHNSEKVDGNQSDIFHSKWLYTTDHSVRSDSSLKSNQHTFLYAESDIYPARSIGLNSGVDSSLRSHALFKSSSSSHITSGKGNGSQSMRHLKFGVSNGERPPSISSLPPAYAPPHPITRNTCCCCSSACCKRANRTESSLSLSDDVETPEGLSWRRLHMSRAKLKATATTSELLSGFAMVAMVELQINKPTAVPEWLFVLFSVCTTILVSVHIFALMISTYLLPNIDAVSKLHVSSLVTESPHDRMKSFIELAWAFSTILGLFLFLVEIAILCWVKFWDYSFTAAISATMIVIPVLILFVAFAIHFYHSLVVIKCKSSVYNMQELENIKRQLDSVSPA